jgi:NADH-quinone oxidoreductase subunit H
MTLHISQFAFYVIISLVKILVVIGAALTAVPLCVYWERKLIAWIQHRDGPTKVGPFGILQTFVDGAKLFLKEDINPGVVESPLHRLAPVLTVVPALFALSIVPFGPVLEFTPTALSLFGFTLTFDPGVYRVALGIADLDIGILAYMAITGVGVYGIVLAGWASNSKYSLLGGIRSTAQMLSYEIALGLSIVGVLLIAGTFNLREIIAGQGGAQMVDGVLKHVGGIWDWNFVKQPMAFLLFMTAGFAETNRLPFDLPEGESELGGGFHTEYSSMKFALFFLSEYINMIVSMGILTTLFLGGFNAPLPQLMLGDPGSILYGISGLAWFVIKVFLLISFMIFIRGTLPRFRYDQLMDFGWKLLFPLALVNLVVTSVVLMSLGGQKMGTIGTVILLVAGVAQIILIDAYLTRRKRKIINAA